MKHRISGVSIIIPTYKRPDVLEQTLEALASVRYTGPIEVIVVDDAPQSETMSLVDQVQEQGFPWPIHLLSQSNLGAASARNRGANKASGELLVFLDDDMIVQPDHVERHSRHLSDPTRRCIINGHWEFSSEIKEEFLDSPFGRFRLELDQWIRTGITRTPISEGLTQPDMLTACNLGIRRNHFLELGGFDESFPSAGYEDQDFAVRAAAEGFIFIYDEEIHLAHIDRRMDLPAFSKRIWQGAYTAAIMAQKYPDEFGRRALISENAPPKIDDGPRLIVKKLIKLAAGSPPGRVILRGWIRSLEKLAPTSALLQKSYWKWSGVWINKGVREGLKHRAGVSRFEQSPKPLAGGGC